MTIEPLVPLHAVSAAHGGKALGLKTLIKKGYPVPDGIALSAQQIPALINGDTVALSALNKWLHLRSGPLAIRSSATNEDGHERSFAGMYETKLNIEPTLSSVISAIRIISESGKSQRVESYGGANISSISVIVQDMIDASISGVAFSRAILANGGEGAYIEWVHGLGECLVSGHVTPASLVLPWNSQLQQLDLSQVMVGQDFLPSQHVSALVEMIEFIAPEGNWDIEWSFDQNDKLFALQMRPATRDVLAPGPRHSDQPLAAAPGVASGPTRIVSDIDHNELIEGEILVTQITETDYVPAMRRASAIVTEEGGLLSHAAIVARELGKPCVVGFKNATNLLETGKPTEVDGNRGVVRQNKLSFGEDSADELDWTSVYIYGRGVEAVINDITVYVEPTLVGLMAHVDEDLESGAHLDLEGALRRRFGAPPRIVVSDRRIWASEWRRFESLKSFRMVEALFMGGISAWSLDDIAEAERVLKAIAVELPHRAAAGHLGNLFMLEAGSAFHAMAAVIVEGHAMWACYRDTAIWREKTSLTFQGLLLLDPEGAEVSNDVGQILKVMNKLAEFRNENYAYFRDAKSFDANYFRTRKNTVKKACREANLTYESDDLSLSLIYRLPEFREMDKILQRDIVKLILNNTS